MKAWCVTDDEVAIYCRAETRGKARFLWPDYYEDFDSVRYLRVERVPRLDGPGPIEHIEPVLEPCPDCGVDDCECYAPWEPRPIDVERTIAAQLERDVAARQARAQASERETAE